MNNSFADPTLDQSNLQTYLTIKQYGMSGIVSISYGFPKNAG